MKGTMLLIASTFVLWSLPLPGCDLCGSYAVQLAKLPKPGFFLGAHEQYTPFGTLQEDGREVTNPAGQYMDSSNTQFLMGYQFGNHLSVQLNLPWLNRRIAVLWRIG